MTPTNASPSSPAGDDRHLVPVDENYIAPSFEDRLALFWAKNSKSVLIVCVLVLLAVLAKGGYEIYSAKHERNIAAAYAAASTDAQLMTFISEHGTHQLAGVAQLHLADNAYASGHFADAQSGYDKAAGILGGTIFGQRARLGSAVSLLQAGKSTEGEAALKQLAGDLALIKGIRAEAAYMLAALASEAGRSADSAKWAGQVSAIDPSGQWMQRAAMLRANQSK